MPTPVTALNALCLILAIAVTSAMAQSFNLSAKVRDFKEKNIDGGHPHFNGPLGCSAQEMAVNTVQDALDVSGATDGSFFGDERGPKLLDPLPASIAACYDPPARFADWFSDAGPEVNRAYLVDLPFSYDNATGLYKYQSNSFFPIDNGKAFSKFRAGDPDPFGHLQTGVVDGKDVSLHNYGFTLELHTTFMYDEGAGQVLRFQGDDDIWVFMNGKRVVDLGGVHQSQADTVNLDARKAELGLMDGMSYPLDFFFAERHVASSSVLITTNLALATPIKHAKHGYRAAPAGAAPVAIYDRSGRLVRNLAMDPAWSGAGATGPAWDGRDASGLAAAPGLYLWRTSVGDAGRLLIP
jgi:fibro-slime domain-containing protein